LELRLSSKAAKTKLFAKMKAKGIVVKPNSRLRGFSCPDSQIWVRRDWVEGLPIVDSVVDCSINKRMVIAAIRKNRYPSINTLLIYRRLWSSFVDKTNKDCYKPTAEHKLPIAI
jgi:hypothetical protein